LHSLIVTTYFAYPENNKNPDKVIFIFSDIFGIYNNSQLVADDFAANGYLAIIPDLFNGDAVKLETFAAGKYDRVAWVSKHGPEDTDPIIDRVIKSLRDDLKIKTIGGVGYCYGGRVTSPEGNIRRYTVLLS
jgi:dienelactone hydrolase